VYKALEKVGVGLNAAMESETVILIMHRM
jgi:hypothetical protein